MKLTTITVTKETERKLTIKGRTGSFKTDGSTGSITMTFDLVEGEHLRGEEAIYKEVNEHVNNALADLMDEDKAAWLKEKSEPNAYTQNMKSLRQVARNGDGYIESK